MGTLTLSASSIHVCFLSSSSTPMPITISLKKKKYICHVCSQELTSLFLGLSWNFTSKTFSFYFLECSQSPIFSYDRQDRALTGTGDHLGLICPEGDGVGVYSGRWREARTPSLLSRFRWYSSKMAAVKQSARSRRSYGKIGDCKQYIYQFHKPINITYITALQVCTLSAFSLSSASFIHWSLLISTPFAFKDVTAKEESQKAMLVYCSYQGRGVRGQFSAVLYEKPIP